MPAHLCFVAIAFHAAPMLSDAGDTERPLALRKAIAARSADLLFTARIEFSVTEKEDGHAGAPRDRFYTWKCAGDRYVLVNQGDDEGVFERDAEGKPVPAWLNRPEHSLVMDGQVWQHMEGTLDACVLGDDSRAFFSLHDLRKMGLNPVTFGSDLDETLRSHGYPPLEYETRVIDGLHVVSGSSGDGGVKWWIDPEKGWNVVRTEVFHEGRKIGERRFELRLDPHDGIWFPRKVELYRLAAGDTDPSSVIELHSTEFNRPEHPAELTPAGIGIEVGTSMTFQDREPVRFGYWDGEKAVPFAELMQRIQSGELTMGASVSRARAQLRSHARRQKLMASAPEATSPDGAPATRPALTIPELEWTTFETQWEAYTRLFIARYRLDKEQAQKAWSVCKDCQERGRAYVANHRSELEELDRRIETAKKPSPAGDKALAAELALQRQKLMGPLAKLFEERLKARLEFLPTRAQREAAQAQRIP
jgi:hypothetical protein